MPPGTGTRSKSGACRSARSTSAAARATRQMRASSSDPLNAGVRPSLAPPDCQQTRESSSRNADFFNARVTVEKAKDLRVESHRILELRRVPRLGNEHPRGVRQVRSPQPHAVRRRENIPTTAHEERPYGDALQACIVDRCDRRIERLEPRLVWAERRRLAAAHGAVPGILFNRMVERDPVAIAPAEPCTELP